MTRPAQRRPSATANARRREVERCLAEHGLLSGPRRYAHDPWPAEEDVARRLALALGRLGPTFTAFGIYLASRADLLPAADCLQLAALPERVTPEPVAAVLAQIARELGRSPADLFASFDETACESSLLFQAHGARLAAGDEVVVRIVRPALGERLAEDLGCLDMLAAVEVRRDRLGAALTEEAADFKASLEQDLDLTAQAEALEALSADAAHLGGNALFASPWVVKELTAPGVITFERLAGTTAAEHLRLASEQGDPAGRGSAYEGARRLSAAWLNQALQGQVFPIEPRAANVLILDDGRVAFSGGSFARTGAALQGNLWSYLAAAAEHDPDGACSYLLREMRRQGPGGEEQLRLRLRQAVPFRDGAWSMEGDSLAELLFVQWRFARECGFRPGARLLPFCRGLAAMATTVRRLDPRRDAVREGLYAARLQASVEPLRQMLDPRQLGGNLTRYATLLAQLPQDLDRALSVGAEGRERQWNGDAAEPGRAGRAEAWVPLIAFVLALAALALLVREATAAGWSGIEQAAAILALVLGGLLLRALGARG